MGYGNIDDTLCTHSKPRAAGLAAMGLWTVSLSYVVQQRTDGFVPAWYVQSWPGGKKHADALVSSGLWSCVTSPERGWQFHDYSDWNITRAQDDERKRREAERKARFREGLSRGTSKPVPPDVPRDRTRDRAGTSGGHDAGPLDQTRPDQTRESPTGTPEDTPDDFVVGPPRRPAAPTPRQRKAPATAAPTTYLITDKHAEWARSRAPLVNLGTETERFLDWARSRGKTFADWDAAWRNWMSRAQQDGEQRPVLRGLPGGSAAAVPVASTTDRKLAQTYQLVERLREQESQ